MTANLSIRGGASGGNRSGIGLKCLRRCESSSKQTPSAHHRSNILAADQRENRHRACRQRTDPDLIARQQQRAFGDITPRYESRADWTIRMNGCVKSPSTKELCDSGQTRALSAPIPECSGCKKIRTSWEVSTWSPDLEPSSHGQRWHEMDLRIPLLAEEQWL